jgi:hypothetical protein
MLEVHFPVLDEPVLGEQGLDLDEIEETHSVLAWRDTCYSPRRGGGAQCSVYPWTKQKQGYPGFADYEAKPDRQIPVVILDPV